VTSPRPQFALLAVGLFLLAGCFGKGNDAPSTPVNRSAAPAVNNTTALPDRPGVCNGCQETNKTESGLGAVAHTHDYWHGREQVVVFSQNVYVSQTPVFPDGPGTQPKSVAYVKLPQPNLVYEGTDKVTILGKPLSCPTDTFFGSAAPSTCQPSPDAPSYSIQYRSAADSKWRDPLPLPAGQPVTITVTPEETDMPHSVSSLWVFRITTASVTDGFQYLNLTITAYKGRDVVSWPGHPNFYADSNVRKIADNKHVKTHMTGIEGGLLYDQGGTWAAPDRLVSYGTGKLLVIINITSITSQTGQTASGYFLEAHNATVIGPEITFGDRYHDVNSKNDLKSYTFEVPVDAAGMDSPYQPVSRWGFRAMATFADVGGVVGLCPGCFDYDIEYDMTIFAIHTDDAAGIQM
jgi:hypothetical protein